MLHLVASVSIACADGRLDDPIVVSDSAGMRIITLREQPTTVPQWAIDPEPVVTIGTSFGEESYQLSRVRAAFAHANGFLIGDGGSGELRLFDASGRHLKSVGGIGSGPGEFQAGISGAMQWLGRIRGDTLVAWDHPLQRITIFDPDLDFVRTDPFRLQVMAYVVVGAFADGELFIWPFGARAGGIAAPRVVVDTSYFAVVSRDQADLDTIARVAARPTYLEPDGTSVRVPFTADPAYAVGQDRVWLGNGQAGQIQRYTQSGEIDLIVRLPPGGPVPDAAIQAFRATFLEGHTGADLAERTRVLDAIPFPTVLPAFDILQADPAGNLWVRHYLLPEAADQTWLILSSAGDVLGSMDLPRSLRVTSISEDLIVGVMRDELDVETVNGYRFHVR